MAPFIEGGLDGEGYLDGFGVLISKTNEVFIGEFKAGLPDGWGILIGRDGKYHGEFKKGHPDGKVLLVADRCFSVSYVDQRAAEKRSEINLPQKVEKVAQSAQSGSVIKQTDFPTAYPGHWVGPTCSYHGTFDSVKLATSLGVLIYTKEDGFDKIFVGEFQQGLVSDKRGVLVEKEDVYVGALIKSARQGMGILFRKEIGYSFGLFADDKWDDPDGVLIDKEGLRVDHFDLRNIKFLGDMYYLGMFKTDIGDRFKKYKKEGWGRITYENGDEYTGNWKESLWDGEGVLTSQKTGVYRGLFSKGKKQGLGTMTHTNGVDCYTGPFQNDLPHGKGKLTTKNYTYEGDFFDGRMEGHGTITWKNGTTYRGPVKGGKPHGRGKFSYPHGLYEFESDFNEGKPIDLATLHFTQGQIKRFVGAWNEKDVPQSGTLIYAFGAEYTGELSGELPTLIRSGKGIMKYPVSPDLSSAGSISSYEGFWENDLYHGKGILHYSNGVIFKGKFKQGALSGQAYQFIPPNIILEGRWDHGFPSQVKVSQGTADDMEKKEIWEPQEKVVPAPQPAPTSAEKGHTRRVSAKERGKLVRTTGGIFPQQRVEEKASPTPAARSTDTPPVSQPAPSVKTAKSDPAISPRVEKAASSVAFASQSTEIPPRAAVKGVQLKASPDLRDEVFTDKTNSPLQTIVHGSA